MEEFSNLYPVAPLVLKESFEITKHHCRRPVYTTGKGHYTYSKPYESQFFTVTLMVTSYKYLLRLCAIVPIVGPHRKRTATHTSI